MDLDSIKINLENNIEKYPTEISFFRSVGLDIDRSGFVSENSFIETPTRIYKASIWRSNIDAFTYMGNDVFIHDTEIKRYCSIAKSVNIGHGNHPTSWLSTNPFMYDQNFRINSGELFLFHKQYSSYVVPTTNRQRLKEDIKFPPKTLIGNDVWIGTGAIILSNVSIGDGAVIGAGSVVTKDIPPYAIAVGNPARVIRYRFDEKQIKELLRLRWWEYSPWDLHKQNIKFYNIDEAIDKLSEIVENKSIKKYKPIKIKISDLSEIYRRVTQRE